MRKLFALAVVVVALLLQVSCRDKASSGFLLTTANDTLSYSAGMYSSVDLHYMVYKEIGIDSTTIDEFIAGVRAAYPLNITPRSRAYTYGLSLGAAAMDMLQKSGEIVNVGADGLNSQLFLEGVLASISGNEKTLSMDFAEDYCKYNKHGVSSNVFMQRNKKRPTVTTLPSGLQYKVDKMGNGAVAGYNDVVSCKYKGTFINGAIFDTSGDEVRDFQVSGLIPGFAEALMLFPEGTECKIYIPWELAYGDKGNNIVPPYCALIFDLEIVKVKKQN